MYKMKTTIYGTSEDASVIVLREIKQGDKGILVTVAQYLLLQTVDGNFGIKTVDAIKKFQSDSSLPSTGIVDIPTWNALLGKSNGL